MHRPKHTWTLMVATALLWAILCYFNPVNQQDHLLNRTTGGILLAGLLAAVNSCLLFLAAQVSGLAARYPGNTHLAGTLDNYLKVTLYGGLGFMILFFASMLLARATGFTLLAGIMTWLGDHMWFITTLCVLLLIIAGGIWAIEWLITKVYPFLSRTWLVPVLAGIALLILLFNSSFITYLPKLETLDDRERIHAMQQDSIAAAERAQEFAKKAAQDAAAATAAQNSLLASNQETTSATIADNGANEDKGDKLVQTITTPGVTMTNSPGNQNIAVDFKIAQPQHH